MHDPSTFPVPDPDKARQTVSTLYVLQAIPWVLLMILWIVLGGAVWVVIMALAVIETILGFLRRCLETLTWAGLALMMRAAPRRLQEEARRKQ